ncbi:MAG: hypothetical protein J5I98_27895 [Phaeodactylibacter sp.]|nr:hypothetical protein [Phaeodactylibacter sp.]
MSCLLNHIAILLLLPAWCLGQKKEIPLASLTYEGESMQLLVKTLNYEPEVAFEGNTLVVPDGVIPNKVLNLAFRVNSSKDDLGLSFNVRAGTGIQSLKESTGLPLENIFTTVKFRLDFGPDQMNTGLSIEVQDKDKRSIGNYRLNILLKPLKPATADPLAACLEIKDPEGRLGCLENLPSKTAAANGEIEKLRAQKTLAQQGLNEFRMGVTGTNSYSLTCISCEASQFNLTLKPTHYARKAPGNKGWMMDNIRQTITAEITSRQWPGLAKRTFYLKYVPPAGKPSVVKPGETEKEEEKTNPPPKEDEPEPSLVIVDDSTEIQRNTPVTDTSMVIADSLWQDSVAPLLNVPNVFNLDTTLTARLEAYRETGPSPYRRALAVALLYWWVILPAAVLLLLLAALSGRKKKPAVTAMQQQAEAPAAAQPSGRPRIARTTIPDEREGGEEEVEVEDEGVVPEEEEGAIEFQEVEKDSRHGGVEQPALAQVAGSPDYIRLNLKECWRDTSVSWIYFSKESVRDISLMLREENAFDIRKDNVEDLSEIGGFLLGHFYPSENGDYQVAVTTFIPITPEKNDRYTVKFGDKAWSELDDAFRQYPGQRLLGWFHTHPGHGLFLSNADIDVHKYSFDKKYQFALEIDPTTPRCDVAFFSWQKTGKINNRDDRAMNRWWSFLDLEKRSNII